MTENIKELRKAIPIPLTEAIELLKNNNSDIQKCIDIFKTNSIRIICELTGCDKSMASKYYESEKFDFNRTVSSIREDLYDKNYKPIDNITKEKLRQILQWINIAQSEDFGISLNYINMNIVIETIKLIPNLSDISALLEQAKKAKDVLFDGYDDNMPIEEFVRRNKKLDDNSSFQAANENIPLRLTIIKEELLRHLRNMPELTE